MTWNSTPIDEYVAAVQTLAADKNLQGSDVYVFLASEDPLAVHGFLDAAQVHGWTVSVDASFQEFQPFLLPEHGKEFGRSTGIGGIDVCLDGPPSQRLCVDDVQQLESNVERTPEGGDRPAVRPLHVNGRSDPG